MPLAMISPRAPKRVAKPDPLGYSYTKGQRDEITCIPCFQMNWTKEGNEMLAVSKYVKLGLVHVRAKLMRTEVKCLLHDSTAIP